MLRIRRKRMGISQMREVYSAAAVFKILNQQTVGSEDPAVFVGAPQKRHNLPGGVALRKYVSMCTFGDGLVRAVICHKSKPASRDVKRTLKTGEITSIIARLCRQIGMHIILVAKRRNPSFVDFILEAQAIGFRRLLYRRLTLITHRQAERNAA